MEEKPIALRASEKDEYYRIDIKREDFKEFIKGVLGERRKIDRNIAGQFVVRLVDLININHMVMQRVERQNQSVVSTFRCVIDFADNFRRTIETLSSFEHMVETKNEAIIAISLEYSFLIQFPDKPFPEKQEIVVRFNTEGRRARVRDRTSPGSYVTEISIANVTLEAFYTELTWGDDIDHMLTPYIAENLLVKQTKGRLASIFDALQVISVILFILYIVYFIIELAGFRDSAALHQRLALFSHLGNINLEDKIDALLIDATSVSPSKYDYVSLILKFVPIMGFSIIVYMKTSEITSMSHIILNKKGEDRLAEEKSKNNLIYIAVVLAFFVSLIAGLAANYVTKLIGWA